MKLVTSRSMSHNRPDDVLSFRGEISMDQFFDVASPGEVLTIRRLEEQGEPALALAMVLFIMSCARQVRTTPAREGISPENASLPTKNGGNADMMAIVTNRLG